MTDWNIRLTNHFGDWVQENGKIKMKVISDKGYTREYDFFSIKELINPKYSTWELIKMILLKYNEVSGGSDIASKQSNHYDNLLLCLAAVEDCADESDLMLWRQRFNSKFKN